MLKLPNEANVLAIMHLTTLMVNSERFGRELASYCLACFPFARRMRCLRFGFGGGA